MRFENKLLNIISDDACNYFERYRRRKLLDLTEVDESGRTLLHWAAQEAAVEIADSIICRAPTIIDVEDVEGQTALRIAVGEGHLLMASVLVGKGASLRSSCDIRFGTLRQLANTYGHHDVEALLKIAEENPEILSVPSHRKA